MEKIILEAKKINKQFTNGTLIQVLTDISFSVTEGEFVAIVGKSGCGKSTLLYVLSSMDTDYSGQLLIDNELVTGASPKRLARIRNEKIGFVFQFHYLLAEFSVFDNIMLPALKLNKLSKKEIADQAIYWLRKLDIEKQKDKLPHLLSGGEKQRVAIARALINKPLLIMGDEPTGNLDKVNSEIVLNTFKHLASEFNQSLIIVTHDPDFAAGADRIIVMEDGKVTRQ